MNNVRYKSGRLLLLVALSVVLLVPTSLYSQVVITQEQFTSIFTPGTRFYINQAPAQVNIGRPGGPQIFDFSSFSLQSPDSSNNYSVGSIPALAARYPADAVTFGYAPNDIEKNPVFLSRNDSVFVVGEASVVPTYRFVHYRPYTFIGKFPTVYGATYSAMTTRLDTTYTLGWQYVTSNQSSSNEITTIEAYGTLRLSVGDYPCIRIKKAHTGYGDKEFIYMTREGIFVDVAEIPLSDPDSGLVNAFMMVIRKGSLVSVDEGRNQVSEFRLHQNYPNPFNPSTTIEYRIPNKELVTLKVYDLLGREIATLVNDVKEPGTYNARFDGVGLSSGLYFARLTAGRSSSTLKMALIK